MIQTEMETMEFMDYKQLYEEMLDKCVRQEAQIVALRNEDRALQMKGVILPNSGYEWLANLQYKVKSLTTRITSFETGEKYIEMKAAFKVQLAEKDREIRKLKAELAGSNAQNVKMRENWSQVYDDLEKEYAKELKKKDGEIRTMETRALNAERQRDETKDRLLEKTRELYRMETELEEERGKNQKLKAQLNRDHENSSIPTSQEPNRKKIANTREQSGKKPGGQRGHEWHPRKWHEPTIRVDIPAPEEYADSTRYKPTGKVITKQLVDIRVDVIVTEYSTPEFRDLLTRQRVYAKFPGSLVNEVTYSGNVKALAFLLNNRCNVSIANVSGFISELTGYKLNISTGMICGLSKEFSLKTDVEQKKAFSDLLLSPVMNVDFTSVRVNGESMNVAVCATPTTTMYFAREHKGHEGVKGTPVENYQNTLVHDHDVTFQKYGDNHQECNQHPERYLKGIMENEPDTKWSGQMRDLIREMIHFRNCLDPKDGRDPDKIDPGKVAALEARYDEILAIAKEEYDYVPPTKYNRDGFNLYRRMEKYRDSHLLFLHDRRVPPTNNLAERLLRVIKRKMAQVMTFRSFNGLDYLCRSLGIVATLQHQSNNLYESVASIYDRSVKQ
jgi:hypothetical protein